MSYSSQNNPKSSLANKIHVFDEKNYASWNAQAMILLEIMDHDMIDINNAFKLKPTFGYSKEDRRLISLDVKSRTAIGNSLFYHIYRLVQNYESAN